MLVLLWIIISIGIYKCCTDTPFIRTNESEKNIQNENKSNITSNDKKQESYSDKIRVLLKTDNFAGIYHKELQVSGTEGLIIQIGEQIIECEPNQIYILNKDTISDNKEAIIKSKNNGKIKCQNIVRSSQPEYRGELNCYLSEEGITVINELPVEQYLYGVVPSEMPSSYPLEALKAQAITARTYTYYHMKDYAYPQWKAHIDDSTSYQVYMNIPETDASTQAVNETANLVLKYNGELVESFYYSTSSGYSAGGEVWGNESNMSYLLSSGNDIFAQNDIEGEQKYREYINNGNVQDSEYNEPWYRWSYELCFGENRIKTFFDNLYQMSISNPDNVKIRSQFLQSHLLTSEKCINDIKILDRKKSGLVTSILIQTPNFSVNVRTQHTIRQALMITGDKLVKKDKTEYTLSNILPSAFFCFDKLSNNIQNGDTQNINVIDGIKIYGAGMGHGAGMSQNGAKNLAVKGFAASEILAYYYNADLNNIDDGG